MRVFYVLYVPDPELRVCLETLRLLYDPTAAHPAHITVRGPYVQRLNVSALSARLEGQPILLEGVDYFFERGQHTVFLEAFAADLQDVWSKPGFSFLPHLTLYDGPSRRDALELYQIVTRYPIRLSFHARGLEPLISSPSQTTTNLIADLNFELVQSVARMPLDSESLMSIGDRRRAAAAERICRHLAELSAATDPTLEAPTRDGVRLGLRPGWTALERPRAPHAS